MPSEAEKATGSVQTASEVSSSVHAQPMKFAHDTHQTSVLLVAPSGEKHPSNTTGDQKDIGGVYSTATEVATIVRVPLQEATIQQ